MITAVRITVSAFVTSPEADAEKSASGTVEIGGDTQSRDWNTIMASLIRQATAHGPDDFPLKGVELMTPEQVQEYLDNQDLD